MTELDIANGKQPYSPYKLKNVYKEYFKMFIENRKVDGKNGISGVTIWGISDRGTWLNNQAEYKGYQQYPLLWDSDFNCKPAFDGVLEAALEAKEQ
ncbi:MAG: endo-1,4-beta-xylanase [Treponema sp.]|nr:endo-1,4-beta-xylanase [Treponema sp.]